MISKAFFFLIAIVTQSAIFASAQAPMPAARNPHRYFNLEPQWDEEKVCQNPHKGWYVHYFDNGLRKYNDKIEPSDDLKDFPGLNDIYLRLAWSYLEPEEGKFNWELIDAEIRRWTARGYKISFRISCKEFGDATYATPKWVERAGAKGKMIERNGIRSWEPDYGDPIFLKKLDNFHKAFAARYDGKPYVEYIDIGSYGDWGEGHTAFSERRDWPVDVIKKHIDIHVNNYKNTQLFISDDIVGSREATDGSREEIMQHIISNNISLRDDGVSVKWFADRFGRSTLRNPEFFESFWPRLPINLELEHYPNTVRENTWLDGKPFEYAIEEARATYIGFHGYPRQWLAENTALANKLANKVGYWFFFRSVVLPQYYERGKTGHFSFVAMNRGVAPAYHFYNFEVRLRSASGEIYSQVLPQVDCRLWTPGRFSSETHLLQIPANARPGKYVVEIAMYEDTPVRRYLQLPFKDTSMTEGRFYRVGDVEIIEPMMLSK